MSPFKRFRRWLKAPFVRAWGQAKFWVLRATQTPLRRPEDFFQIPIIINNFNRLEYPLQLIGWLEKAGYRNIHILDNASTYPPLLAYYAQCPHQVHFLGKNWGFMALWESGIFERFRSDFYVYTDPDILPIEECPPTILETFWQVLADNPDAQKVGFSLKIDDLPDHYARRQEVLAMETPYWQRRRSAQVFDAKVDTTFALYRPGAAGDHRIKALRTAPPFTARHLPWYIDSDNLPVEEIFYKNLASDSNSW
jgi:GT2 family glycosyltransferase